MISTKDKVVLIYDTGAGVELAKLFVSKFKKVYYFTPWTQNGFPDFNPRFIGVGIKGVEKVEDLWKLVDSGEVDLFIFLDVYDGDLAFHLKAIGKNVVSAFYGKKFELDRQYFQDFLKSKGLPISEFTPYKGITKLREGLKGKKDKYIKISNLRGITETLKFENDIVSASELDDLSHRLGDLREEIIFLVQDPIGDDKAVEWGWEGFFTGSSFSDTILCGIEAKDCAYYGRVIKVSQAPKMVTVINEAFKDALKELSYQQHFSTEIRQVDPETGYFSDSTNRGPHPPSELMYYLYENMAEIYMGLATGTHVEPITRFEYGVQVVIHSEWGEDHFLSIVIPEEYRENVFLKNYTIIDGIPRVIPQSYNLQEIGAVVAGGKTIDEAVKKVKDIIGAINQRNLKFPEEHLDKIEEEIKKLEAFGINFYSKEPLKEPESKKEEVVEEKKPVKKFNPKAQNFLKKLAS